MNKVVKYILTSITVIVVLLIIAGMILIIYDANQRTESSSDSTTFEKVETEESTSDCFNFQEVGNQPIGNMGVKATFYREVTTDVMYVVTQSTTTFKSGSGICVMMNPETGLPLTYADWLNDYKAIK